MKLYFNGCSHTVGICSDLHDIKQTYPYKLSKGLDAEFINSASPRSSNSRIFRTTIEDICSMDLLPDIAVIQWTYYDRFESPMLSDEFEWARSLWKDYRMRDKEWKQFNPMALNKSGSDNIVEIEYRQNKLNSFYSFFTGVIALDNFITGKGIRPVHMFFPGSKWLRKDNDVVRSLLNNCNRDNWLNSPFTGIDAYLDNQAHEIAEDGHYLESAHDQIALWLKDFILLNKHIEYVERKELIDNDKKKDFIYPG